MFKIQRRYGYTWTDIRMHPRSRQIRYFETESAAKNWALVNLGIGYRQWTRIIETS